MIKTKRSYYLYPLDKTHLNLIKDKRYLINKVKSWKERTIENKCMNEIGIVVQKK